MQTSYSDMFFVTSTTPVFHDGDWFNVSLRKSITWTGEFVFAEVLALVLWLTEQDATQKSRETNSAPLSLLLHSIIPYRVNTEELMSSDSLFYPCLEVISINQIEGWFPCLWKITPPSRLSASSQACGILYCCSRSLSFKPCIFPQFSFAQHGSR
jgi:hypothetical protein